MTPVEKGSIELGLTLNLLESSKFIFFASTIPFFPVPAFALPELITSNLGLIFVKFCLANITGAAQNLFLVKTAQKIDRSFNSKIKKSFFFDFSFTFALNVKKLNPGTGSMSFFNGFFKLTLTSSSRLFLVVYLLTAHHMIQFVFLLDRLFDNPY